jgi:hypothetical protein
MIVSAAAVYSIVGFEPDGEASGGAGRLQAAKPNVRIRKINLKLDWSMRMMVLSSWINYIH